MHYDAFISYSHASDARLAPALKAALGGFARPWYKRRGLSIFRDKDNLEANPDAWLFVERALSQSRWFVLMASPRSAGAKWVKRELDWWLANRPPARILIALTDGEIVWDDARGDFNWRESTALPNLFEKRFTGEPLFVDLRWTRAEADVSASSPRFLDAVATLAAAISGKPRDELIGDDYRQHRNFKRAVATVVLCLSLITGVAAYQWRQAVLETRQASAQSLTLRAADMLRRRNDQVAKLLLALALQIQPTDETMDAAIGFYAGQPAASVTLTGHGLDVTSAVFDLNDQRIISSSGDDTVRFWDANTARQLGAPLRVGNGKTPLSAQLHPGEARDGVDAMAFSDEHQQLVTAGKDAQLRLWDTRTQHLIARNGFDDPATTFDVGFVAGSREVVSVRADRVVRVWNTEKNTVIEYQLPSDGGGVSLAAFSPDGRRLVTINSEGGIRLSDSRTGASLRRLAEIPRGEQSALAFAPDGKVVIASAGDTLRLYEADTGKAVDAPPALQGAQITAVAMSRNGQFGAAGDAAGSLHLWDVPRARWIGMPLRGHEGRVLRIAFDHGGSRLVSSSVDATARVWDLHPRHPIGVPVAKLDVLADPLVINSDGTKIAAAANGSMFVWDNWVTAAPPSRACNTDVHALAFDFSEKTLLVGNGTSLLECDIATGQPVGRPVEEFVGIESGLISGGEPHLAIGRGTTTRLGWWDFSAGRAVRPSNLGGDIPVSAIARSPNGRRVVVGSPDGTLRQWDALHGELIGQPMRGHFGSVSDVAYSDDGMRVVSSSLDGSVRLWNAENGAPLGRPLRADGSAMMLSAALFHHGDRLVSAGDDDMVRQWDAATGKAIGAPLQAGARLKISSNGSRMVTAAADGILKLWDLDTITSPDALRAVLCASSRRELTPDEWTRYVPAGVAVRRICENPL